MADEDAVKMALVRKTALGGYFRKRQSLVREQPQGQAQPLIEQPSVRRESHCVLERFQEVVVRDIEALSELAKDDWMVDMCEHFLLRDTNLPGCQLCAITRSGSPRRRFHCTTGATGACWALFGTVLRRWPNQRRRGHARPREKMSLDSRMGSGIPDLIRNGHACTISGQGHATARRQESWPYAPNRRNSRPPSTDALRQPLIPTQLLDTWRTAIWQRIGNNIRARLVD